MPKTDKIKKLPNRQCKIDQPYFIFRENRKSKHHDEKESKIVRKSVNRFDIIETESERTETSSEGSKKILPLLRSSKDDTSTTSKEILSNEIPKTVEIVFEDIDYFECENKSKEVDSSKEISVLTCSSPDKENKMPLKRRRKGSQLTRKRSKVSKIFYVEKIVDMKIENGERKFLLKWTGFPDSKNSWEPEENLGGNLLLQKFLKSRGEISASRSISDSDNIDYGEISMDKTIIDKTTTDLLQQDENEIDDSQMDIENETENVIEISDDSVSNDEHKDKDRKFSNEERESVINIINEEEINKVEKSQHEETAKQDSQSIIPDQCDENINFVRDHENEIFQEKQSKECHEKIDTEQEMNDSKMDIENETEDVIEISEDSVSNEEHKDKDKSDIHREEGESEKNVINEEEINKVEKNQHEEIVNHDSESVIPHQCDENTNFIRVDMSKELQEEQSKECHQIIDTEKEINDSKMDIENETDGVIEINEDCALKDKDSKIHTESTQSEINIVNEEVKSQFERTVNHESESIIPGQCEDTNCFKDDGEGEKFHDNQSEECQQIIDKKNVNQMNDNSNSITKEIESKINEEELEDVDNEPLFLRVKHQKKNNLKRKKSKRLAAIKRKSNYFDSDIYENFGSDESMEMQDSEGTETSNENVEEDSDNDSIKYSKRMKKTRKNNTGGKKKKTEEIFTVEKILETKFIKGVRHFFLKWEGYPDSENTWEPEKNLECPELIEEFLDKERNKKRSKRRSRLISEESVELEELPDDVEIKDLPVKAGRFSKSREAEIVLAAGKMNDELMFLIKWKNMDMANLVPAERAHKNCPQVVLQYYQSRIRWENYDKTITKQPKENLATPYDDQFENRPRIAETMESLISVVLENARNQSEVMPESAPRKVARKEKNVTNKEARPQIKAKRNSSPKMRPWTDKSAPNPLDGKVDTTTNENRPVTGSSSHSMMDCINRFKDRRLEPAQVSSSVNVPIKPQPVSNDSGDLFSRDYDSRGLPAEPVPPHKIQLPKPNTASILRPINSFRLDFNPRKLQTNVRPIRYPLQGTTSAVRVPYLRPRVVPQPVTVRQIRMNQYNVPSSYQIESIDLSRSSNILIPINNQSLVINHPQLVGSSQMQPHYFQLTDTFTEQRNDYNCVAINNYFPLSNVSGGNGAMHYGNSQLINRDNRNSLVTSSRPSNLSQPVQVIQNLRNFTNPPQDPTEMQLVEIAMASRAERNLVTEGSQNSIVPSNVINWDIDYQTRAPGPIVSAQNQYVRQFDASSSGGVVQQNEETNANRSKSVASANDRSIAADSNDDLSFPGMEGW